MKFADIFKDLRQTKGLTQAELADALCMSRSRIGMYEQGRREPDFETLEKIADFFNVRMASLVDDSFFPFDNITPIEERSFPILGTVSCGVPKYAEQNLLGYVSTKLDVNADFVLIAKGDSMINAGIRDGYYVFIKKMSMVDNGAIAAVIINDEALLKRVYYYPEKNLLILRAENSAYEDLIFSGPELDSITILGRAVMFQGKI